MTSAALRQSIENTLAKRVASPLTTRERAEPERVACGIAAVDRLLQGGVPAGVISEVVGPECSGRTSLALAYVAAVMARGNVCAWIDVSDTLDPESAAANGVDLSRMLWVRCGKPADAGGVAAATAADKPAMLMAASPETPRHTGGGSRHPRAEGRDMPQAVAALMQSHGGMYEKQLRRERKKIGTPGAPNRPLTYRSDDREEQVNSDRLPSRRGENAAGGYAPRCAGPLPRRIARMPQAPGLLAVPTPAPAAAVQAQGYGKARHDPWQALDQALRTADLLLQNGGFSAVVLDLGSTPAEFAWRIPLATWFRFRSACERTRVSLVLLTQHACARSSAELVVRMERGDMQAEGRLMSGIRFQAEVERARSARGEGKVLSVRKPPQPERPGQWMSHAAWANGR